MITEQQLRKLASFTQVIRCDDFEYVEICTLDGTYICNMGASEKIAFIDLMISPTDLGNPHQYPKLFTQLKMFQKITRLLGLEETKELEGDLSNYEDVVISWYLDIDPQEFKTILRTVYSQVNRLK